MQYAIEAKGLTKKYSAFTLNAVDILLPMGAIMGLVGANGAGKSTAIKAILGLIHRDGGTVAVLGADPMAEDLSAKKDIGVVFEESSFHDPLKIPQVSKIMAGIYPNFDSALFDSYVQRFELPTNQKLKEFSRGMKMKVSLAAAFAHRPRLLILDEATSGLDPIVRNQVLGMLREFIQDEQCSVLLSSHITADLEKVCDYIAFLHKGELVFSLPFDEMEETYGLVKLTGEQLAALNKEHAIFVQQNRYGSEVLVKDRAAFEAQNPGIPTEKATIEDIMLFHVEGVKL